MTMNRSPSSSCATIDGQSSVQSSFAQHGDLWQLRNVIAFLPASVQSQRPSCFRSCDAFPRVREEKARSFSRGNRQFPAFPLHLLKPPSEHSSSPSKKASSRSTGALAVLHIISPHYVMQAARFAPRAARSTRALGRPQALRAARRNVRSYATETPAPPANHTTAGVIGGVAGGMLVFLAGYGWYHMSGAKSFVAAAHETKSYFDKAFQKTKEAAPEPNQALQWLRDTTLSYAALIPGAKSYVNTAFDDLDTIHDKHGSEVDSIVKDAYNELKDASKDGASMQTVASAWEVLQKAMKRIGDLAGDAADDILQNHPELKEKVGGSLTDLKNMGKQYGPEAQKKVDETWSQVQDIIKGGVGVGAVDKIRKLVQERSEDLKSFGDQAWKKGMEQAQPFLDKQPELKKMVEENKDKLLKGDLGNLWKQVQEAASSGSTDDLQKFVKDQVSGAGGKAGGGLDSLLGMIPGGGEIMPKLQQLQELSQKHGKDVEKLMKEAMEDIQKVLQEKTEEGKKIAEQATKEAKK